MSKELVLKKCLKCGALVKVMNACKCKDCNLSCCGEKMITVKPNSVDAAFEKHVPTYEKEGNKLIVKVNHVMESDHYIEWICLITEEKEEYKYFKPEQEAIAVFTDVEEGILYAYCNKHGLWKSEIK